MVLSNKMYGKTVPFWKVAPKGGPKDSVLWRAKRCPKGAVLVPIIFLSAALKVGHNNILVTKTCTDTWRQLCVTFLLGDRNEMLSRADRKYNGFTYFGK